MYPGFVYRATIMPINRVFDITDIVYHDTTHVVDEDARTSFYCPLVSYRVNGVQHSSYGRAFYATGPGGLKEHIYLVK
jgi:hypothetical protein